jgi:acyl-CoA hydrolase
LIQLSIVRLRIKLPVNKKQNRKIIAMAKRREVTLRFLAEPTDVNFGGKVHGGAVMKWIDQCGYACAAGWSGRYCVTVSVSNIRFTRPIFVGHLVEVKAILAMTGTSSMHIRVQVSSSDPKDVDYQETTDCLIVFVALDEAGRVTLVPKWKPRSETDIAMELEAKRFSTR